ncbi:hypothetical protein V8D89_002674 [Ganoderma adspersum]
MGRGLNEPPTNPNDLTAIPAGPGTEGHDPTKHKRKQTLLSLLDALAELSKDEELDGTAICQPCSRRPWAIGRRTLSTMMSSDGRFLLSVL